MALIVDQLSYFLRRLEAFYITNWTALATSLAIALGVNLGVMVLEMIAVGWEHSSMRHLFKGPLSKSALTDIVAFFLVQSSLAIVIGAVLTLGSVNVFTSFVRAGLSPWQVNTLVSPVTFFLIYLLLIDFCNYWAHRMFHEVDCLWEIHKYHHSATEMTVLTATRDHPLERLFNTLFVLLPVALLAPPRESFLLAALVSVIGPLKHSNADWGWSWFGKYIIQSPRAHRVHHSIEARHYNRNFAGIFSFWDLIFRTWHEPEEVRAIGLSPNPYNRDPVYDLIATYFSFLKVLKARIASLLGNRPSNA